MCCYAECRGAIPNILKSFVNINFGVYLWFLTFFADCHWADRRLEKCPSALKEFFWFIILY